MLRFHLEFSLPVGVVIYFHPCFWASEAAKNGMSHTDTYGCTYTHARISVKANSPNR